jgi:hypothetical protein
MRKDLPVITHDRLDWCRFLPFPTPASAGERESMAVSFCLRKGGFPLLAPLGRE